MFLTRSTSLQVQLPHTSQVGPQCAADSRGAGSHVHPRDRVDREKAAVRVPGQSVCSASPVGQFDLKRHGINCLLVFFFSLSPESACHAQYGRPVSPFDDICPGKSSRISAILRPYHIKTVVRGVPGLPVRVVASNRDWMTDDWHEIQNTKPNGATRTLQHGIFWLQ